MRFPQEHTCHLSKPYVDCSPKHPKTFILADTSMLFQVVQNCCLSLPTRRKPQCRKGHGIRIAYRVRGTKPDLLIAWTGSQGFEYREGSSKASLCARADDIRKWLEDPKLFNRPPRRHQAPDKT